MQRPASLTLLAGKCPSSSLALTNLVYIHPDDERTLSMGAGNANYALIKGFVYTFKGSDKVKKGTLALSSIQRRVTMLSLNEPVLVEAYVPTSPVIYLETLKLDVDFLSKGTKGGDFDADELKKLVIREFANQFFTLEQVFVADVAGNTLKFQVIDLSVVDLKYITGETNKKEESTGKRQDRGILLKGTDVTFVKAPSSNIRLAGASGRGGGGMRLRPDWNFEKMGIGGLDNEFSDIFRRAFASRVFDSSFVQKLGIKHVKGILLYGPPGTGKTLMARQIGLMLNGKEPKVVNGPEILNKYVGQSEENIRNQFKDAEAEYKERGDDSDLHIIIFDEIDAICPARGTRSGGTGVADTVVNQLLSKIDGVDALNNILVIGMTNRKDMIDEALLRPGRLEVHIEIGLPDKHGRLQILRIHTAKMRDNNFLEADVSLDDLAERTKNFSGAEIEGLVKSAASYAFDRQIDASNPTKPVDPSKVRVTKADFDNSLSEVTPAFGVSTAEFANAAPNGIIEYGAAFAHVMKTCKLFVQQVENSSRTPLVSVLLEGTVGCGKTSLASNLAVTSGFPYVKLISPEQMVGASETAKCSKIAKVFEDAYKSPLSVIVVDDIERLLDYVPIGPRFSNAVLQTLLVLLKRQPPPGKKLLILGTSSSKDVLEAMEFMEVFNAVVSLPNVESGAEVAQVLAELKVFGPSDLALIAKQFSGTVPVKKLLMIAEMAQQGEDGTLVERFFQCMADYGMSSGASFTIKHK
jgi:vesicle-fusing ATPase